MNPLPAAGAVPYAQIQLVGDLMPWVVGVLLLLLFLQLPRFGAHRNLLGTWIAAWFALIIGHTGGMLSTLNIFVGNSIGAPVLQAASFLTLPGRLTFLVLVTVAAVVASGRRIPGTRQREVAMVAVLVGLLLAFVDTHSLVRRMLLVATPVLFFGSAHLVFAAARGERERGMTFLALGMVLFALLSTLYQVLGYSALPLLGADAEAVLLATSGYGRAFALALLGAAVVVLVVQDSVLQVARTREEHLRDVGASEARLKRIIEAAGEAILTFGPDRRIDLANGTAARIFRLPAGSVVGRRLDDLMTLDEGDWDGTLAPVFSERRSRVTVNGSGIRPAETPFPLECTVGPLDDGEDRAGGVAILRDLTQRRAAEAERERFERRVAESEKMLAIGRVVSGVAHELNNPLAVVLGQSEQLVDAGSAEEVREGLQLINEQAHRARHIVKDLLAFVRPRDDRREPVDLGELVRRVVASQAGEARSHGVSVTVESDDRRALVVLADRLGLEQVVVNLIDNAMDATGSGGIVRITFGQEAQSGLLHVEDDGPGVPEEIKDRIFEPFFTTKPTGQGTGLGLAVSVGLLEHLGGSLALENRPRDGVGARFVVRLPLAPGRVTSTSAPMTEAPLLSGPVLPADRQAFAMIIDDEPAVRSTLARIFTRWGWRVREEGDAARALEVLGGGGEETPAVVLCDLKMPGMSGSEFYEALRARAPELSSRVVFVTGDVVETDTAQFLATAGREVVEKPFTIAEIARTVERAVSRD